MAFPIGVIPRGAVRSALKQIDAVKALSAVPAGPRWLSIGPAPIVVFDSVAGVEQPVAGRVAAVALDPSDPAHWLIGAAHGGIWETRNSGKTWADKLLPPHAITVTVAGLGDEPRQITIEGPVSLVGSSEPDPGG